MPLLFLREGLRGKPFSAKRDSFVNTGLKSRLAWRTTGTSTLGLFQHAGLAIIARGAGVQLNQPLFGSGELKAERFCPGRFGGHLFNVVPERLGDLVIDFLVQIGAHPDSDGGPDALGQLNARFLKLRAMRQKGGVRRQSST